MTPGRYFQTRDTVFIRYISSYNDKGSTFATFPIHSMASTPRPPSPETFMEPPPELVLKRQVNHDPAATAASKAAAQEAAAARLPGEIAELVADSAEAAVSRDPLKVSEAVADALKVVSDVELVADCHCCTCLGWAAWRRAGAPPLSSVQAIHRAGMAEATGAAGAARGPPPAAQAPTLAMAVAPPSARTLAADAGPASVFSYLK
jgi:hypothetical protein